MMRLARAVVLGATTVLALAGLSAPVHADDPDPSEALITCLGTVTVDYTPGLTTTLQPVHADAAGTLGPCVTVLGSDFSNGTITYDGGGELSCLSGGGGQSSGVGTIEWAGGQESDFTYTAGVALRPGGITALVVTGTVSSGTFVGATVTQTVVFASLDLLSCFTPQGITTTSGPVTVTVTPAPA